VTDVHRDASPVISLGMNVRDVDLLERNGPGGCGLGVDALLGFPGSPFGGIVDLGEGGDVRESSDAIDGAGAEVEGRSGGGVSGGEGSVALGGEGFGDGNEGVGIIGGGAVVDVVLGAVNRGERERGEGNLLG
jgi:hypothetical protein